MSIFDSLIDPSQVGGRIQSAFRAGQKEREEYEVRGALSAYATNPDDPAAFETLARYRPEMAIQIRERQSKAATEAETSRLTVLAAKGDRAAQAQLWGLDPDLADKIADNDRARLGDRVGAIGNAALRISQLPVEQRPAAWDGAIDQLARDYPELSEYKGQYSEQALMSAIDNAKQVSEYFSLSRPSYQAVPEGGTLVNTRDPAAVASFASGATGDIPTINDPAEASKLPPGTQFRTPDGRTLRVPGGGASNGTGIFRP